MVKRILSLPTLFVLLSLTVLGFLLYSNILSNDFVWVDTPYIVNNAETHSFNLYDLFDGSSATGTSYYRPLAAVYFALMYTFVKAQPFWYHVIQIALHIGNAFLLFILLAKCFKRPVSFYASVIYLIHPLNESAVAFISATADEMYMFFGLSAITLLSYRRFTVRTRIMVVLLLLCSMLSKEAGVLFLIIALLYSYFFAIHTRKYLVSFAGIILSLYILIRYSFHGFIFEKVELFPMANLSLLQRITNIPQIVYFYIQKFFVPVQIGGGHIWIIRDLRFDTFYYPLLVDFSFALGLVLVGMYLFYKHPSIFKKYLFFFIIFLLGLTPYLQLIPLDFTVTGRWFAVSMIGLLGMAGTILSHSDIKNKRIYGMMGIILVSLSALLFYRTLLRNQVWKNDETLFERYVSIEDNYIVEGWLATALIKRGDLPNALIHAQAAVDMFPYDNNLVLLAYIHEKLGNETEAQRYYRKSLKANNFGPGKHDANTYSILIRFLILRNDFATVKQLLADASTDYPKNGYFWLLKAIVESNLQNKDEALADIAQAEKLYPDKDVVSQIRFRIIKNLPIDPEF